MPRLLKFQPRQPQPLTPAILSQSQIHQKQYAIPFAYLSQFPSLDEDSDLSRMKDEANHRSISVKEAISNEMCRMLKLKAENWSSMMTQVSQALPSDLDHLNPLTSTMGLEKYAKGYEGIEIRSVGKDSVSYTSTKDEASSVGPATPTARRHSTIGGGGSTDATDAAPSPSHEAIRSAIEGYEDVKVKSDSKSSSSPSVQQQQHTHLQKQESKTFPSQNEHATMHTELNTTTFHHVEPPEQLNSKNKSKTKNKSKNKTTAPSLQRKDSQAAIEMKFRMLKGVQLQLNEITANNVLRGVSTNDDTLIYYPQRRATVGGGLPARQAIEPFELEIKLLLKYSAAMINLPLKFGQWKFFNCPSNGTLKLQRFLLTKDSQLVFRHMFWYVYVKRYQLPTQPRTLRMLAHNIGSSYSNLISKIKTKNHSLKDFLFTMLPFSMVANIC